MAEHTHMLKIDISDPALQDVSSYYKIQDVPWIVVLNQDKVAISESPNKDTEEKILELVRADLGEIQRANSLTPRGSTIEPVTTDSVDTEEPEGENQVVNLYKITEHLPEEDSTVEYVELSDIPNTHVLPANATDEVLLEQME